MHVLVKHFLSFIYKYASLLSKKKNMFSGNLKRVIFAQNLLEIAFISYSKTKRIMGHFVLGQNLFT